MWRASSRCLVVLISGLSMGVAPSVSPAFPMSDSLAFRAEIGTSGDVSNELFYEQSYTDTTFLGRRLHGTPEQHAAAVALVELVGRSVDRRWEYSVRPEMSLGDRFARGAASGVVRLHTASQWRLSLEPRAELLHDRRFDLDRHELLVASTIAARRRFPGRPDQFDVRLGAEELRTAGSDDPFLLAHHLVRGSAGWEHDGYGVVGWSARYAADWRSFPDSTNRDHIEQRLEGSVNHEFLGGHAVSLASAIVRRVAQHTVVSTRDCFSQPRGELSGTMRWGERFTARAAVAGEWMLYDWPDSLVDFNYGTQRGELELRRELGSRLALALTPQIERLGSSWAPAERYLEPAFALAAEWLDAGSWWFVAPAIGRRNYEASQGGDSTDPAAIHSSYQFVEVQVMGDQALPARLRARVTIDARAERHDDPSQDSRSLYFSLDLRRLF